MDSASKDESKDAAQAGSKMTKAEFEAEAAKPMSSLDDSKEEADLKEIRELYTRLAHEPGHDYGWGTGPENARTLGYKSEWIDGFPKTVFESNAAGGCPFSLGDIFEGATVVDFGCGAGGDVCVAAKLVGPAGKVIGVDLTPAMLKKAQANVDACGFTDRVEFIQASPEWPQLSGGKRGGKEYKVQIPKGSVDFVISNNVVNLIAAKL